MNETMKVSENSWVAQTQSQAPPLTVGTLRAEVLSWGWRLSGKKPLLSVSWFPGAQARVLWELPCQCLEVGLVWGLDLIPLCCSDPGGSEIQNLLSHNPLPCRSLWASVVPTAKWVCKGDGSCPAWGLAPRVSACEGHQSGLYALSMLASVPWATGRMVVSLAATPCLVRDTDK